MKGPLRSPSGTTARIERSIEVGNYRVPQPLISLPLDRSGEPTLHRPGNPCTFAK